MRHRKIIEDELTDKTNSADTSTQQTTYILGGIAEILLDIRDLLILNTKIK